VTAFCVSSNFNCSDNRIIFGFVVRTSVLKKED
jgi:hypothetical protein